jgi:hypothetical protein
VATRGFQVDTAPPASPTLSSTSPASPANDNSPKIIGSAPAGTTVRIYAGANCSGTPIAVASAVDLASGVAVTVSDDSTSKFTATATTAAANTSSCSAALSYLEDSTAPDTEITEGPPAQADSGNASIAFTGSDWNGSGVASFECSLDSGPWTACDSPATYSNLADGQHSFEVRARDGAHNTDSSPAHDEWSVVSETSPAPNPPGPPNPPNQSPSGQAQYLRTLRNPKSGTASLVFQVTGPGRILTRAALVSEIAKPGRKSDAMSTAAITEVRLRQRSIRPATTSVSGPGQVKVPIKLTPIGRKLLQIQHVIKVRVNVSFVALDGSTTNFKLDLKLVKRPSSRHKSRNQAP